MHNRISLFVFLLVIGGLFNGCNSDESRYIPTVDNSKLSKVNIHIKRYGKALFGLDTTHFRTGLDSIKPEYMFFLNADLNDTANVNQLKAFVSDTLNRYLYNNTMKEISSIESMEHIISSSLSYYRYYFPDMKLPVFYSYVSGGFYEAPVMVSNNVVVIGLDNYLGANFPHYGRLRIPKYKTRWMIKEEIPVDVMRVLYNSLPYRMTKPRNLLDMMVAAGKELFFLDATMPDVADSLKIKYTQEQMDWIQNNEKNIWGFLISQKFLFSADFMQTKKLMQDGPFTKGFEKGAPARIGEWVGWQIVSTYMQKHPEVSLKQLLKMQDAQMILNESGYKP